MTDNNMLITQQVEDISKPFRRFLGMHPPTRGWIQAIRVALGMTNIQLARRLGRAAPQSIEDLQRSEAAGTIKLDSLREVAEAMGCRLVYAVVPIKPLDQMRKNRAIEVAREAIKRTSHSMTLEAQDIGPREERRALERHVLRLLDGNPKRLWD